MLQLCFSLHFLSSSYNRLRGKELKYGLLRNCKFPNNSLTNPPQPTNKRIYLFFVLPYGKDREVTGITEAFENLSYIYIYIASIRIYRNNRKDSTNKRRSCSRQHEEGDEIRFGSFYRESFVCLTWIYRWNQWRIFVYKYKLSLVLLYWNDMLMNKLKTKSNGVLNRMVSKTESNRRIHNFFGRNVSAKATQMASNVEFVGKKTWQQWGHLRTKIVIVDSKKICQISSFLCSIVSLF